MSSILSLLMHQEETRKKKYHSTKTAKLHDRKQWIRLWRRVINNVSMQKYLKCIKSEYYHRITRYEMKGGTYVVEQAPTAFKEIILWRKSAYAAYL